MSNLFIHIGFPKTASSSLQNSLFFKHSQIQCFGKTRVEEDAQICNRDLDLFYQNIRTLDYLEYQDSGNDKLFEMIRQSFAQDKKAVFSEEQFTNSKKLLADRGLMAQRLKELMPDAKIIAVIRNQIDGLRSMYDYKPADPLCGYDKRFMTFDEWLERCFEFKERSYLAALKYFEILDYYALLFGEENVGIFVFEKFIQKPDEFSQEIADFLGIDCPETKELLYSRHDNVGRTDKMKMYMKIKKNFLGNVSLSSLLPEKSIKHFSRWLETGKTNKTEVSEEWKQKIREHYRQSNQKLRDRYCPEIVQYGYPV